MVLVADKEWICATCTRSKNGDSGFDVASSGAVQSMPRSIVPAEVKLDDLISGEKWSTAEKRIHLNSLPHHSLVSLLIHATTIHPSLPVFPSSQPQSTASEIPMAINGVGGQAMPRSEDKVAIEADIFDDDPPAHYPKPGFGLAQNLPPENEHLPWLVDENDEVFSHVFPADEGLVEGNGASQSSNGSGGFVGSYLQVATDENSPRLETNEYGKDQMDKEPEGDGLAFETEDIAAAHMDVDANDGEDHIVVIEKR